MKTASFAAPETARDLTLVLNAAESRLQIVVGDAENSLLFSQEWHAPSRGVELLMPALQSAFALYGLTSSRIRRIACVRGPGSFTGLRLVLASASGLARSTGARLAGLEYLPLLGLNARPLLELVGEHGTPLWVLTHARRNLVHAQAFRLRAESPYGLAPLTDILVLPVEDDDPGLTLAASMAALTPAGGYRAFVLGSGFYRNREAAVTTALAKGLELLPLPESCGHPVPATLLQAAADAEYSNVDIPPLYARPCDAEENLESIAGKLGLDPLKARQKLQKQTSGLPERL